jgi:hypothetical protein
MSIREELLKQALATTRTSSLKKVRNALCRGRSLYFIWSDARPGLQLILEDKGLGKAADITQSCAEALDMSEMVLEGRLLTTPMQVIYALSDVLPAFPEMIVDNAENPWRKSVATAMQKVQQGAH